MSAYSDTVLGLGPSLYWDLAANGATDLSGNGRNGTGVGGISLGGFAGSPISGETTSTDFDGSAHYVSSTYTPFTNGSSLTICGWANRDTVSSGDALFGSDAATTNVRCYLQTNNDLNLDLDDSAGTATGWVGYWPGTGSWGFWVVTINETTDLAEAYLNGTSANVSSVTDPYNTPGNFKVGARGATTGFAFDGKLAHVAVFESILGRDYLVLLYNNAIDGGNNLPSASDPRHPGLFGPGAETGSLGLDVST